MESLEREKSSTHSAQIVCQQQLFAEEKKQLVLEAATKEAQGLLKEKIAENEKLQQELAAAKAIPPPPPSPPKGAVEDPDVVAALRADIVRLQNKTEELVLKSNTIEERYKNGDLVRSLPFPPREVVY